MKHMMRRMIQLTVLALLLPLWPAGDADAQFAGVLRGEYDVSVQRACAIDTGDLSTHHIAVQGQSNFDGNGGVSLTGQFLIPRSSTPPGTGIPTGGSSDLLLIQGDPFTCTGNYSVNSDGTFTQTLNCNLTFATGPDVGQTATLNGVKIRGKLAHDGTVLLLRNTAAIVGDIETLNCPGCNSGAGFTFRRLCSAVGVATARR